MLINMFCKNCGEEVKENQVACLSCGFDSRKGNKHCPGCGAATSSEQIVCIKCHAPLKNGAKTVAIVSYLTLIGFIVALIQHNNNKTTLGAYHLRQGVGLLCTSVGLAILLWILTLPTLVMRYRYVENYTAFIAVLSFIICIGLLVFVIMGILNAANEKEKPVPVFGKLYEKWFANMFN